MLAVSVAQTTVNTPNGPNVSVGLQTRQDQAIILLISGNELQFFTLALPRN